MGCRRDLLVLFLGWAAQGGQATLCDTAIEKEATLASELEAEVMRSSLLQLRIRSPQPSAGGQPVVSAAAGGVATELSVASSFGTNRDSVVFTGLDSSVGIPVASASNGVVASGFVPEASASAMSLKDAGTLRSTEGNEGGMLQLGRAQVAKLGLASGGGEDIFEEVSREAREIAEDLLLQAGALDPNAASPEVILVAATPAARLDSDAANRMANDTDKAYDQLLKDALRTPMDNVQDKVSSMSMEEGLLWGSGVGLGCVFLAWSFGICSGARNSNEDDDPEMMRQYRCIYCSLTRESAICFVILIIVAVAGFFILWKTHIIQAAMKEMIMYVYLLLIVGSLVGLAIYEFYADISYLTSNAKALAKAAHRVENLADDVVGAKDNSLAKQAYFIMGAFGRRVDAFTNRLLGMQEADAAPPRRAASGLSLGLAPGRTAPGRTAPGRSGAAASGAGAAGERSSGAWEVGGEGD